MIKRLLKAFWRRRCYFYALPLFRELLRLRLYHSVSHIKLSEKEFGRFNLTIDDMVRRPCTLERANQYLNDVYEIFGVKKQLEDHKWNQDIRTGYVWSSGKPFFDYKIINYQTHSDVKFPWDISRCHHMLMLGEAYQITGNERYSEKIKSDILDFYKKNPFLRSVNWTCPMDVGIRAANWLHAISLIRKSPVLNDSGFVKKFAVSISEHAFFIEKNLEKGSPYSGNHYIANLAGILHIYVLFGRKDKKWAYFLNEFNNEIRNQVLPSGFHYEKSTSYHKLVFEMILFTYLLLKKNGIEFDIDVVEKIKQMARFMNNIIQPDGNIPFIGDNDNGCFLPFVHKGYADGTAIMEVARKSFTTEVFNKRGTAFYADANFCVIRKGELFATIHNNPMSRYSKEAGNQLYNTHTHCDMLSFTISDGIHNLIVDPGTYCYTSSPELRQKYRSTSMHNTICVGGLDQQAQNTKNLFSLTQYSFPKVSRMNGENSYEGAYDFIDNGSVVYRHNRCLKLEVGRCVVEDIVQGKREMTAKSYFYLSPDAIAEKVGNRILISSQDRVYEIVVTANLPYDIAVLPCEIAPSYGSLLQSSVIVVSFDRFFDDLRCKVSINSNNKAS